MQLLILEGMVMGFFFCLSKDEVVRKMSNLDDVKKNEENNLS